MTLGDSHAKANGSWLTYSGSFLKDSDTESYLSLSLTPWPARLFQYITFFSTQNIQLISSLWFACKTFVYRDHVRFIITCSIYEVSNSGIVPCPSVCTTPLRTSLLTTWYEEKRRLLRQPRKTCGPRVSRSHHDCAGVTQEGHLWAKNWDFDLCRM